jgi:hypothetical protein
MKDLHADFFERWARTEIFSAQPSFREKESYCSEILLRRSDLVLCYNNNKPTDMPPNSNKASRSTNRC